MDPATTGARFPFDVLGIIFDYYLDEETIYFPLETMLLVCRSWNEAALGHRKLWARLKIYIGHFPTSEIWRSRLPRRLERAGHSTLLEIDLRSILDSPNRPRGLQADFNFDRCNRREHNTLSMLGCGCIFAARHTVKALLVILTGPHGELCHRWKSLYLCLNSSTISVHQELAYPTPNLEAVWLERPAIARGVFILPSIPKLKTFEIFTPSFFTLPKVENVRNLVILGSGRWDMDLSNLQTAVNVETLKIRRDKTSIRAFISYALPQFLPHLSSFSFIGNYLPHNLKEVQAPNLRRLSLESVYSKIHQTIIDSSLPLCDVQELELTWPSIGVFEELKRTTSNLLLSCINLTCIKSDRRTLSVIVKLYWEGCATSAERGHTMGKTLSFWSNDVGRYVILRRPEGRSELEGVALSLGLIPPNRSWDYVQAFL